MGGRVHEQTLVSEVNFVYSRHTIPTLFFGMNLSTESKIGTGLNYILGHFLFQPRFLLIFPRTISTKTTEGRQILVDSQQEVLARFAQANFIDCRISAYPPDATVNPSGLERFQGLRIITRRI